MRRLLPCRASAVAAIAAMAIGGAAGVLGASAASALTVRPSAARSGVQRAHLTVAWRPSPNQFGQIVAPVAAVQAANRAVRRLPKVVLPDLFAVASGTITAAELNRIGTLPGVSSVLAVDGGRVSIGGHAVSTIGVDAALFRSWTPAQTAARQGVWTALGRGELVTTPTAAKKLGLQGGDVYQVSGARQVSVGFGGTADLGIPRVDAVVGSATSRALGLVSQVGVLVSAPKADLTKLGAQIRAVLGRSSQFLSLRPARHAGVQRAQVSLGQNPAHVPAGRPNNWLQLFQASAALYCPQLSWTVLAAIAQIESGDGQNMGPSSAGALGPMQFLPSTWARWGIDAFGFTGPPNIKNAWDAVPAAADYLCASGASQGPPGYAAAIFSYNHATWYVAEVLALAQEYAQVYG